MERALFERPEAASDMVVRVRVPIPGHRRDPGSGTTST